MKPIWYFVGYILFLIGLILFITGIVSLSYPPEVKPVLYELHADIWWGAIMAVAGLIYILKNRNVRIE